MIAPFCSQASFYTLYREQSYVLTNQGAAAHTLSMDANRMAVVAFYKEAMRVTELDATPLAEKAGLAHTTIRRFLKNPEKYNLPTLATLKKVADFARLPLPQFEGPVAHSRTPMPLREEDLIRLIRDLVAEAVKWDREMKGEIDAEVLLEGAEAVAKEHLAGFPADNPSTLGNALVKVMARRAKVR